MADKFLAYGTRTHLSALFDFDLDEACFPACAARFGA